MLYDYHSYQNAQKPDSIHATYLVYGIKRNEKASEDGDVEMSSPVPEHDPTSEEVPSTTLSLVREENLKGRVTCCWMTGDSLTVITDALAGYQEVTSIHVYSLAPHPQRDLSLLSDVSKALSEYSLKDPDSTKYGAIINPQVRRRDRQARPKPTAPSSSKPTKSQSASVKPEPSATEPKPASAATKVKQEAKAEPPSKESTPSSSTSKPTPSQKKGVSGGIMQSFAKAAQKPAKPKQEPKKEKDTTMSDDGEADDDDIAPSKKADKGEDTGRKSRKEREEELRRMMEEDEDKEEDPEEEEEDPADEDMEEAPEPEPEPQAETKEDNEPSEVVSIENGRRRGKRRVMKKKRILDDQGYMGKLSYFSSGPTKQLINLSHNPGGRMGVLFRGRSTTTGQEGDSGRDAGIFGRETQETRRERYPGEHHVILLQEMRVLTGYLTELTKSFPCTRRLA